MKSVIVLTILWCLLSCLYIRGTNAQECPANRDKDWSYELSFPNGPLDWGDDNPGCDGKSQSPINIVTHETTKAKNGQKLKLIGYDTPVTKVTIENNGHTIVITPKDGTMRSLQLDKEKYTLQSFHFHWGNTTTKGSEHAVNGRKFAMEGHFVHKNDKKEIAVVGVFFEEHYKTNSALKHTLHVRDDYLYEDESYEGSLWHGKIHLHHLVDNGCSYYRYNGSLTTPPCSENVNWLVCKHSKPVKKSQMKQLYSLYSVERGTDDLKQCHLINNFRPLQKLNGRKVYA